MVREKIIEVKGMIYTNDAWINNEKYREKNVYNDKSEKIIEVKIKNVLMIR